MTNPHPLRRYLPDATPTECRHFDHGRRRDGAAHQQWRETGGRRGWPCWLFLSAASARAVRRAQRAAGKAADLETVERALNESYRAMKASE